jgi:hypothetical protein
MSPHHVLMLDDLKSYSLVFIDRDNYHYYVKLPSFSLRSRYGAVFKNMTRDEIVSFCVLEGIELVIETSGRNQAC